MRCLILTVVTLACCQASLGAQRVPGRELLQFPLGTIDRAPALAGGISDGLGNPAAIVLPEGYRARVGLVAVQTSTEQGVSIYIAAAALDLPQRFTVGLSAVRASVNDLYRTGTDPTAFGAEIPYVSSLYSATIARRNGGRVATGIALRYRIGEIERSRQGAFGIDGGVLVERLPFADASVGAATFLWRPANADEERTTLNVAGDLRALGRERRVVRAGYSLAVTEGREIEHFGYARGRYDRWEGLAGLLNARVYGASTWRNRLAVRLHYGEYIVAVARESGESGLSSTYQFTLAMTLRDR